LAAANWRGYPGSGGYTLSIDAIDRVPSLQIRGAHARERLLNRRIECRNYAYEQGIDMPEVTGWKWPL
jgi:xylulose-5-phosphate/fructose-6-phosphate phosphoketolase